MAPFPFFQHVPQSRLGGKQHGFEIDTHHAIPLFLGEFVKQRVPGDPGIVDQDIHLAKNGCDFMEQRLHIVPHRYIAPHRQYVGIPLSQQRFTCGGTVVTEVGQHHPGAFRSKQLRRGEPNAPGGSGYYNHLMGKSHSNHPS